MKTDKTIFELTKFGKASTQKVFFLPKCFKIAMNRKFPTTPPMYVVDPIHDATSLLTGPLTSGVSFDCKTRRLFYNQFAINQR